MLNIHLRTFTHNTCQIGFDMYFFCFIYSSCWDLNPGSLVYKTNALPLSHKSNCLIDTLMKQNDNLQDKLLKANTKIKNVNNNRFNLNVFLNNDCKDAMNLMDFVGVYLIYY